MQFNDYVAKVQKGYNNQNKEAIKSLEKEHGNDTLTYKEAEQVVAEQTYGLLQYVATYKGVSLAQFDLLVNQLSENKIFTPENIDRIKKANDKMIKEANKKFKELLNSGEQDKE